MLAEGFDAGDARELLLGGRARRRGSSSSATTRTSPQVVHDLTGARVDFKKGGVAGVRLDGTRGELIALLRPRELDRHA